MFMKFDEFGDIDIGNAVSVCHAESFIIEVIPDSFESSTGHGIVSCIDQSHLPWFGGVLVSLHCPGFQIEGNV